MINSAKKHLWYQINPDEVLLELNSTRSGLTANEAKVRLLRYGPNELKGKKKTPTALVFLRQFLSPLVYILFAAAIIKVLVGSYLDAGVILGVLVLMASIGFFQETRAEKAMEHCLVTSESVPKYKLPFRQLLLRLLGQGNTPLDMHRFDELCRYGDLSQERSKLNN